MILISLLYSKLRLVSISNIKAKSISRIGVLISWLIFARKLNFNFEASLKAEINLVLTTFLLVRLWVTL